MATNIERTLSHHGVLGMHWGQHKTEASTPKAPRKKFKDMTEKEQQHYKNKQDLAVVSTIAGTYAAAKISSHYIARHPEVLARAANKVAGTKALGVGYKTVQLILKNGTYVLK